MTRRTAKSFVPAEYRRIMTDSEEFRRVLERLDAQGDCAVGNLIGSSAALFVSALAGSRGGVTVVVAPTSGEAQGLVDDLRFFHTPVSVRYLPTRDESDLYGEARASVFGRRVDVCQDMASATDPLVVVTSVAAALQPVPPPQRMVESWMSLEVGQKIDRDQLAQSLVETGFERMPLVERPGQLSVRGVVIDVFDYVSSRPTRIEFDGDVIDSMREFDHQSQLSVCELQTTALSLLCPDDEAVLGEEGFWRHLPDDALVCLRDPDQVEESGRHHLEVEDDEQVDIGEVMSLASLHISRLPVGTDEGVDFQVGAIQARGTDLEGAIATLDSLSADGSRVGVCFVTDSERDRFWTSVDEEAEPLVADTLRDRPIASFMDTVFCGFRWRSMKCVLVNHRELFDLAIERRPVPRSEATQSRAIDDFVDLNEGDYVVHIAHGIARFLGVERIEKNGEIQEFFTLEFRDELRLYVPVAKADLVQKYIGGRGEAPLLSRLGGRTWTRRKEEVFKACADLAAEILETQAIRAKKEGISFPPDAPWQHEFEAAFPHEETPDQLDSADRIREDMQSPRPMDRLLCGDVGYGKTEVAMRAAFRAAMAGRQAAILVPTTVLAEQHAVTFKERMAGYPVEVACLSRFRSRKEQEQVIVGLVEGKVDIVIGTHRLLSSDVSFKDVGLIVIDEEQRFGVAQKEALRSLRRTVDILTLTATPIPRTLHLSLLGIRDISSLTQAPSGRHPVRTRVVRFDEKLVRTGVLKEMERGGKCFFVHNRVQTIEKIARQLRGIVPEARILTIHGQMKGREIDTNLRTFIRGDVDVLLATTIVESGLDIPTANTIFIDRPDMYGLAELHQLRGRVGRQREQAYAWLLLRPDTILNSDAEKRLRAIEELDELGSGFRIAMRDLEIRGAGNILGQQQHGHITAVGYDMYCRLLDAAVRHLKKQRVVLPDEVDLNLDFEAYLPSDWIPDPRTKLETYRRLGRAEGEDDFLRIIDEMRDRFGPVPSKALEFVDVCRIRATAQRMQLKTLAVSEGRGLMLVPGDMKLLQRRLHVTGSDHRIIDNRKILLPFEGGYERPADVLDHLEKALSAEETVES